MSDLRNDGDLITIIDDDGQEFELEYMVFENHVMVWVVG